MALRMLYNKAESYDQALSTTVQYLLRPSWARAVDIVADGDFEWLFTEKPQLVSFYDASGTSYTDLTAAVTDGSTAGTGTGTGNSLNEMTTDDSLYMAFNAPVSGVYFDIGNTNSAGTATSDLEYYGVPASPAWTNITETDNTFSTRTLAQDGSITFTALTNWVPVGINNGTAFPFVLRYNVSATLTDTSVSILRILGLQNVQTYAEAEAGSAGAAFVPRIRFDSTRVGGIQLKAAAGAPNCTVTWYGRV